jgi:hypothetical protein
MSSSETVEQQTGKPLRTLGLVLGLLGLAGAVPLTWNTVEGLSSRRHLREELAEMSHAKYELLNASQWVEKIQPILDARIDQLDLKADAEANLRPMVQNALYRLLDGMKDQMSKPPDGGASGGFLAQGNAMVVNMVVAALRPHVPEYTNVVLAELGRPDTKQALRKYVKGVLADAARTTFSNQDMRWHDYILKKHGCAGRVECKQKLGELIRAADERITRDYLAVLAVSTAAFLLLMLPGASLGRPQTVVLMLFCLVLLAGGILTPMLEVEARITSLSLTFLGQPISFNDQVLYFQSKSVLEVFHTLVTAGRTDMWVVGVLVLMFSVVFPLIKVLSLVLCLFRPKLLSGNRVIKFFALESSKWSMADVMALAIFMTFIAFNGLIPSSMNGLREAGAQLAIPTDSSKILPGYHLFIGFCLASLFLSRKLQRGIRTTME